MPPRSPPSSPSFLSYHNIGGDGERWRGPSPTPPRRMEQGDENEDFPQRVHGTRDTDLPLSSLTNYTVLKRDVDGIGSKKTAGPAVSFVHCKSLPPITVLSPKPIAAKTELELMQCVDAAERAHKAETALTVAESSLKTCQVLLQENAQLKTTSSELTDRVSFLQEMAKDIAADPAALDASIGALRGRLLESCRVEETRLREQVLSQDSELSKLRERVRIMELRESALVVQARLLAEENSEIKVLSEARNKAIEALDGELAHQRASMDDMNQKLVDATAREHAQQVEITALKTQQVQSQTALDTMEQQLEHLSKEMVKRGLDVLQPRRLPQQQQQLPITTPRSLDHEHDVQSRRESELRRVNLSLLEEIERLRNSKGDVLFISNDDGTKERAVLKLRERVAELTNELTLVHQDRARERHKYMAELCASHAKERAAMTKAMKADKYRKESRMARFAARAAMAELAAKSVATNSWR